MRWIVETPEGPVYMEEAELKARLEAGDLPLSTKVRREDARTGWPTSYWSELRAEPEESAAVPVSPMSPVLPPPSSTSQPASADAVPGPAPAPGDLVSYDPLVLSRFATALYKAADHADRLARSRGTLVGAIIGAAVLLLMDAAIEDFGLKPLGCILLGGFLGGAAGFLLADGKGAGDALRIQAQTALCQVEIEKNTRAARTDRG